MQTGSVIQLALIHPRTLNNVHTTTTAISALRIHQVQYAQPTIMFSRTAVLNKWTKQQIIHVSASVMLREKNGQIIHMICICLNCTLQYPEKNLSFLWLTCTG